MRICSGDFVCILEDDTAALRPFWLKSMIETMAMYPKCGMLMPVESKDGINPDQGFLQWMNGHYKIQNIYGFCNLIRKGVNIVADEKMTYFTDIDNGYQAASQGWDLMINGHVMMRHGSDVLHDRLSGKADILEKQKKDTEYLKQKWGAK
jgi:hypothetical protein